MMDVLNTEVLGNTPLQWGFAILVAAGVAILLRVTLRVVKSRLTTWAARTEFWLDDIVAELLHATRRWFVAGLALLAGAQTLALPDRASLLLGRLFVLAAILQVGFWLNAAVSCWLGRYLRDRGNLEATATIASFVARVLLWSLVLLMALDNIGVNVTTLVTSLGIGGVAVALAVQNVLGDLLASLAIALDKPFVVGDFIVVGEVMGTVDRIGLKTTHLRSLSGELIVVSNNDLLSSRIRNYKRMSERRVVFEFGVTYETPAEQLRKLPDTVRRIVSADALARFDRAHLRSFGASALEFEVVYYVLDPDYARYMDVQQRINLALIDTLRASGIEFAYPTQTIYMATPAGAS